MVVATLSRILSSCKYDMSAWSSFILSTFIPSEIWNCISKPNFKFSKAGEPEDLWQVFLLWILLLLMITFFNAVSIYIYKLPNSSIKYHPPIYPIIVAKYLLRSYDLRNFVNHSYYYYLI